MASAACGQDFYLDLVAGTSSIGPGSSFTISVFGDASVGTHLLGGGFGLESSIDCGDDSMIESMTWQNASWSTFNTDGGWSGGANYNDVIFGQLVIPGVPPFDQPGLGSELGGLIGSYTIVISQDATYLGIEFSLTEIDPFGLGVIDIDTGEIINSSQGTLHLGTARINPLCPSPGGCGVFALAGLVAVRRRRIQDS